MSILYSDWRIYQNNLGQRAEDARTGQLPLSALLADWPVALSEPVAKALVEPLAPPETEEMNRLVAWMEARVDDDGETRAAGAWDRLALARPEPTTPEQRHRAALALLARLGEEYRRREHASPADRVWPSSADDAAVGKAWAALLADPLSLRAGEALAKRFQGALRASVIGVATVLHLPHALAEDLWKRASEQLDLVFPVARGELAAWVVETAGEPVGALMAALGPGPRRKVVACVESRALWVETREILGWEAGKLALAEGTAASVLRRLAAGLAEGRAAPHDLGLPGWGVVAANRARVRGRLRAAAAEDGAALRRALLGLDALEARSASALGRFAWGWAWREARTGFGFDLGRATAPVCTPGPPVRGRPPPLGEAELPALRTFLLLVAGRDAWEDLERWVDGEGGRALGRGLYRCLDAAPDALADPGAPDRRARAYERLRAWLFEGGLEASLPQLAQAAARVAPLTPGRDLRARMREALSPWWDESAIEFPQHHLPGFREGLMRHGGAP